VLAELLLAGGVALSAQVVDKKTLTIEGAKRVNCRRGS
jgi:hypothetical protein